MDLLPEIYRFQAPSLVIIGEQVQPTSPAMGEHVVADIAGCKAAQVPYSYTSVFERPEAYAELVGGVGVGAVMAAGLVARG